MEPNRYERIRQIFLSARSLQGDAREQLLAKQCGSDDDLRREVDAYLADDLSDEDRTQDTAAVAIDPVTDRSLIETAGDQIGRYRLLEVIGEGGFGTVFRASQREPVQREVALKVIKPGMHSAAFIARFEAERQALAVMDHPGIAKVLDGGATQRGLPFFVMELVKGVPITEFCDSNRLSINDRIGLLIQVAEAVQHAHSKGVIHRDLKPSNVLAGYDTEGRIRVKVIDFGVAKALNQRLSEHTLFTQRGQLVGTPEYMSPEQASQSGDDIDTRSDVYALGVILYELLTGARPFDLKGAALHEIQRMICEEEPVKPSTKLSELRSGAKARAQPDRFTAIPRSDSHALSGVLQRDLDWIAMKCLEKNRDRRYETADALAKELGRYLAGEPVLAGPPSVSYRLQKFVRRHRAGVVAACLATVLLMTGLAGTTVGLIEVQRQRDFAMAAQAREAQRAEELELVSNFQSKLLESVEPSRFGQAIRSGLRDRLVRYGNGLSSSSSEQDTTTEQEHTAEFDEFVQTVNFTDLTLSVLNDELFAPTLTSIQTQFTDNTFIQARLLSAQARAMRHLGLDRAAEQPLSQAIQLLRARPEPNDPHLALCLTVQGSLVAGRGDLKNALALQLEALDTVSGNSDDERTVRYTALSNAGLIRRDLGDYAGAEVDFQQAIDGRTLLHGPDDDRTLRSMLNLARLYQSTSRFNEAEALLRHVADTHERVNGQEDFETLLSRKFLASILRARGKDEEAEELLIDTIEKLVDVVGADHPETLAAQANLGLLYSQTGRPGLAEELMRRAIEGRIRIYGTDDVSVGTIRSNLAVVLRRLGRMEEAEPLYIEALESQRRLLGKDHPHTLIAWYNLVTFYGRDRRMDLALSEGRAMLEATRRVLPPGSRNILMSERLVGQILLVAEQYDEAEKMLLGYLDHPNRDQVMKPRHVINDMELLTKHFRERNAAQPNSGYEIMASDMQKRLDSFRTRIQGDHDATE